MPSTVASDDLRIVDDELVRIEETSQNGQLRRVTVAPKGRHTPGYQIILDAGAGRDPAKTDRSLGQSVWSLLHF
jgi:hypothetical protein